MTGTELTPRQAGRVYDRIGRIQDWQRFYEGPAVADLVANADFEHARSIFELGCGTGAFADDLLGGVAAPDATYTGVDVSAKMVDLASSRLARHGERATVELVGGPPPLPGDAGRFDRFVSLYVFDLLSESSAHDLLAEARRLLADGGRLCLVSLTHGPTTASRIIDRLWDRVWRLSPAMVGGCRPTDLLTLLDGWSIDYTERVVAWTVPSQIVVASPIVDEHR